MLRVYKTIKLSVFTYINYSNTSPKSSLLKSIFFIIKRLSPPFNFDVDDDLIIVDCVIREGIRILSPCINTGSNEQAFDLQKLCESFIFQLLTEHMEYDFHLETNGTLRKFEKEATYREFEVNVLATKLFEQRDTYATQFLVTVNFDECVIIKVTELFKLFYIIFFFCIFIYYFQFKTFVHL